MDKRFGYWKAQGSLKYYMPLIKFSLKTQIKMLCGTQLNSVKKVSILSYAILDEEIIHRIAKAKQLWISKPVR